MVGFFLKFCEMLWKTIKYIFVSIWELIRFIWDAISIIFSLIGSILMGTKKGLTGAAGILASTPEAIAERIAVLQEHPLYIVVSITFKIVTAATLISLISAISGMGGFILFFAVFYIYIRGVLTYDPNKYVKK
tara:strand:- start:412 stop:810 length:399 start_codon:yes stop_codon:yes gene_type:complete